MCDITVITVISIYSLTLNPSVSLRLQQPCPSRSQWRVPDVASRYSTASSYWLRGGCGTTPVCAAASVSASCRRTRRCTGGTETSTASRTTAGLRGLAFLCFLFFTFLTLVWFLLPLRMFGGGQCARCFQPIPASDLVMRSGELTFHPHCFSCQVSLEASSYYFRSKNSEYADSLSDVLQECDVKLMPGNLYCMQGANLYCQSHYQSDGGVQPPPDLQPKQHLDGECEELLRPLCASYLFYPVELSHSIWI